MSNFSLSAARLPLVCPNCLQTSPTPPSPGKTLRLWAALSLIGGFAGFEVLAGAYSHSLALAADAGHMAADALAVGLALLANWVAQLPASSQATFGHRRVEVVAALINGAGLTVVALWIAGEALTRVHQLGSEILSGPMLLTATIGLGVNSLNAALLHEHSHDDLNVRGAFLHMVADAVSSLGVLLAGVLVWQLHWFWADWVVSLGVSGLVLMGSTSLVWQSIAILLERVPDRVNLAEVEQHLLAQTGVIAVDRLRIWTLSPGQEFLVACLQVKLETTTQRDRLVRTLQASLQQTFGFTEVTLQLTAAQMMTIAKPLEQLNVSALSQVLLRSQSSDS